MVMTMAVVMVKVVVLMIMMLRQLPPKRTHTVVSQPWQPENVGRPSQPASVGQSTRAGGGHGQESNRSRWDSRPRPRSIKHKEGATVPFLKIRRAMVTTTMATMTPHSPCKNTLSPHVQCLAQASIRKTSANPGNLHASANFPNFKALVNGFVPEDDEGCNGTSMTLHVATQCQNGGGDGDQR